MQNGFISAQHSMKAASEITKNYGNSVLIINLNEHSIFCAVTNNKKTEYLLGMGNYFKINLIKL